MANTDTTEANSELTMDDDGTVYSGLVELQFSHWDGATDGSEDDTYDIAAYFGDAGYKGPDQHGIYPIFDIA